MPAGVSAVNNGSCRECAGKVEAEILQYAHEISGPADCDSAGSGEILNDGRPADHPSGKLSQCNIGIRIGAAGNGDKGSEFSIAKACKYADNCGDEKRDQHGRPCVISRGLPCENKDSSADDGADSNRGQLRRTQMTLQPLFT